MIQTLFEFDGSRSLGVGEINLVVIIDSYLYRNIDIWMTGR